ncbi:hypothetical protein A8990_15516 [Paenibacillus taihuensis]|uniref:Uncharacterized protein n=2 Tax=Paenibacillus taihuensis TaxID=1156355 RepID=A0A3D9Q8X4_9BACL|nr:hypothetical protein A8990_15516 [Paenibacillus taihuensis]
MTTALALISVIITGCKGTEKQLTLADIRSKFEERHIQLTPAKATSSNSVFARPYNGAKPSLYTIHSEKDPSVFIYIYPSASAAAAGFKAFEDQTAAADFISHKEYLFANVILFYIINEPSEVEPIDLAIAALRS